MNRLENAFKNFEIVDSFEMRPDYNGCHHIGFDAISLEDGQCWGIFVTADNKLFLAK